jgi:hypothetical protein
VLDLCIFLFFFLSLSPHILSSPFIVLSLPPLFCRSRQYSTQHSIDCILQPRFPSPSLYAELCVATFQRTRTHRAGCGNSLTHIIYGMYPVILSNSFPALQSRFDPPPPSPQGRQKTHWQRQTTFDRVIDVKLLVRYSSLSKNNCKTQTVRRVYIYMMRDRGGLGNICCKTVKIHNIQCIQSIIESCVVAKVALIPVSTSK